MFQIILGALFLLVGLIANPYGISLIASDSVSAALPGMAGKALWVASFGLILWGITTILFRKRAAVLNCNVALVSMLIFAPLAGELFFRTAIFLEVDFFRNPRLYTGWLDDDDHWKLRYQWRAPTKHVEVFGYVIDPDLGWAPPASAKNPLGILAEQPYQAAPEQPAVLFYGDSYVHGMPPTPIAQRVPQQLDGLLPDHPVYNYGVVGYGIDQTLLRYRKTHAGFENPYIILGIFTVNIDRAFLKVREAPKPYFDIEDEQLQLKGVPVAPDMESWLDDNPLTMKSFLLAFLTQKYRLFAGNYQVSELAYKQQAKKKLARKILEAMVADAKNNEHPLLVVLFYPKWEFNYTGWRETLLRNVLDEYDAAYIDTKALFLNQVEEPKDIEKFYDHRHFHLNELGGEIVAKEIAQHLRRQDLLPETAEYPE